MLLSAAQNGRMFGAL